ncbi:hypothetical protein [Liberiplasma polymorphum]|uniref:hypothetical protein n=1 Tax=Liberiplasma polymorphum TaxID=3374570 RepID=UPI0037730970
MQNISPSCKSKKTYHVATSYEVLSDNKSFLHSLNYHQVNPDFNVINVVSHCYQKNKTQIALSLAQSYAKDGYKTLFLEANFRNPVFHEYFNLDKDNGLSNWIFEGTSRIVSYEKNLDLLASGSSMENIPSFLLSKPFKHLILNLKQMYDKIVIDTPSLSVNLDALITSDYACGNIIIDDINNTSSC